MKILVTGINGMIGSEIKRRFVKHEIVSPGKYQLNIGNFDQVMKFKKDKPNIIIHLAAETDHEYCDLNPTQCYFINTIGVSNMVELAKSLNVPIIYMSAGSIFDGLKNKPYTVLDMPKPINHYNRSKYLGEVIVRSYKKHYIIRAGWMFGGGPAIDKKFVNKIISKIRKGEKKIKVCTDCVGSPTYSRDLVDIIKHMLDIKFSYGTYHISCNSDKGVSRYDFALEIVKILKAHVKIVKCKIDDLKDEFPCKRTNYEVLENNFQGLSRDWRKALKEYINDQYRNK